jgi:hypothetical protein
MWTSRRVEELGKAIVSEGDDVLVIHEKYRCDGRVIGYASGDFTHIVRLVDGRERAFHVRDLRLKEAM